MLIVSSRKTLLNSDEIAIQETVHECKFDSGATTQKQTDFAELETAIKGKRVLLLVHGYNNEFEDVGRSYEIIEDKCGKHLRTQYDAVVGYTWPGGDHGWEWHPAKRRAGSVAPRLARVLREHFQATKSIDLMTHSLGTMVGLKAVSLCPNRWVRTLILLAAAVDNESLEKGEEHYSATQLTEKTVVVHTKKDGVLRAGYTAAEWDAALGLDGPEDPAAIARHSANVFVANGKHKVEAHGHYKYVDDVYKFVNGVLDGTVNTQFSTL